MTDGHRPDEVPRLDLVGQAAVVATLFPLTYALITAPERGWASPLTVSLLALSVVAAGVFVVVERRSSHPLLDLDERSGVAGAIATTSRQVGSNLGVALLGTLVLGTAGAAGFVHGLSLAYGLAAVVSAAAAAFAWWALRRR